MTPPELRDKKRNKRQITGGVVLLTFLLSTAESAITGTATGLTLRQEFDEKLNQLELKTNNHLNQIDANIRDLAGKIHSLEAVNQIQYQAIMRALIQTLTLQTIQQTTNTFLQSEIDTDRRLLLQNLDAYLKQSQTFDSLTLSELELDKLIISEVQNKIGRPFFNNASIYLTKITQGNLFYKKYARKLQRSTQSLKNISYNDDKRFDNQELKLKRHENETFTMIKKDKKNQFANTCLHISD